LYHDVTTSIKKLKELTSSLAGLPGRKAILHVSDGIPMTPGEDLYYMLDARFTGNSTGALTARRFNVRNRFHELTARANANRVTFYTLEAAGLRSHTTLSAEYGGSRSIDGGVSGSRIDVDMVRASSYQEPLQMMALETGGLATFNTNNITGAFDNMATDFRSYYSLGYSPAHSGDGRYHDVEVKVKGRKNLKVRHRAGYRDKTPEHQLSEVTMAALLYGVESNPMNIELRFASGRKDADGNYLLPIEVHIPIGGATLIPQADVYYGKLLVSVAVIDDDGRMSAVQQAQVPLNIPRADNDAARKQSFIYEAQMLMRRGDQRVAVGVRDEFASSASYIRRSVRIGT
ncbi:MAG: VWA domain-containing protein, partial [Thermoanaerobaculia bacterium]